MDITNLSKPKVLAALFNAAKPLGLGYLQYNHHHLMDETEAATLLENQDWFDYVEGRLMKVSIVSQSRALLYGKTETTELNTSMYNLNNGENAAENALSQLFETA